MRQVGNTRVVMQGRRRNRGSDNNTGLARGRHAELKTQVRSIGVPQEVQGQSNKLKDYASDILIAILIRDSAKMRAMRNAMAPLSCICAPKNGGEELQSAEVQTSCSELGRTQISRMLQHPGSDNGVYIPVAGQRSKAVQ